MLYKSGFPVTRIVFDKTISDPANITGHGEGAILDIIAKMRRCLCKKTAEGEVAICYLDNANSNLYADGSPAVLTFAQGDVMVYKPAFYYKYESVDADRFAYTLSEYDLDGTYIYSPASLIGAYKSRALRSKLYSLSGAAPTGSISHANNINYAKARGTGYNIIDFEQHCMIALLFYAKYGTRNSQAVLGVGNANYTSNNTTGSTNSFGVADTANATSGYVNFAGVEGVFGGYYENVGGADIQDGVFKITMPDGTVRSGNATAATSSGWIMEIAASLGPFFDVIPTAVGGSETTNYADFYQYSRNARVLARSSNDAFTSCGVSFTRVYDTSAIYSTYFCSRLAFRGVIVEAESVDAFRSLPII